jgi:hypothetical protein
MTNAELLPAVVPKRKAVVYVRQSTQAHNLPTVPISHHSLSFLFNTLGCQPFRVSR